MKTLLDTCVVVDILNTKKEGIEFFKNLQKKPSVSVLTIAEIFTGIRNKKEEEAFDFFLGFIDIVPLSTAIAMQGGQLKKKFFPSHHTDLIDALIAASALEHNFELKTLNIKHFPMIEGIEKAY
jgi:predicted nucleic acid-binding protein